MRKLVCLACSSITWTLIGVALSIAAEIPILELSHGTERVAYAEFAPDGSKVLTMSYSLRVWQVSDGAILAGIPEASGFFKPVFGPGGREILILNVDTEQFELRSATSGALVLTLPGHVNGYGRALGRIAPSEDMIATLDGEAVRIWEYPSGRLRHRISNGQPISDVVFSLKWPSVYTSQYEVVTQWSAETGQPRWHSTFPRMIGDKLAISSESFVATIAGVKTNLVALMDFSSAGEVIDIFRDTSMVSDITFSEDGTTIAIGFYNGVATAWSVKTGFHRCRTTSAEAVLDVETSPDSRLLLVTAGNSATLWDLQSCKEIARFEHSDAVRSAKFSRDGALVVTSGNDGFARVYNVQGK